MGNTEWDGDYVVLTNEKVFKEVRNLLDPIPGLVSFIQNPGISITQKQYEEFLLKSQIARDNLERAISILKKCFEVCNGDAIMDLFNKLVEENQAFKTSVSSFGNKSEENPTIDQLAEFLRSRKVYAFDEYLNYLIVIHLDIEAGILLLATERGYKMELPLSSIKSAGKNAIHFHVRISSPSQLPIKRLDFVDVSKFETPEMAREYVKRRTLDLMPKRNS